MATILTILTNGDMAAPHALSLTHYESCFMSLAKHIVNTIFCLS